MKTIVIAAYFLITVALHVTAEDFQNTEYYRDYLKFLKVSGAEASQKLMVQQMFDQIKRRHQVKFLPIALNNKCWMSSPY